MGGGGGGGIFHPHAPSLLSLSLSLSPSEVKLRQESCSGKPVLVRKAGGGGGADFPQFPQKDSIMLAWFFGFPSRPRASATAAVRHSQYSSGRTGLNFFTSHAIAVDIL